VWWRGGDVPKRCICLMQTDVRIHIRTGDIMAHLTISVPGRARGACRCPATHAAYWRLPTRAVGAPYTTLFTYPCLCMFMSSLVTFYIRQAAATVLLLSF